MTAPLRSEARFYDNLEGSAEAYHRLIADISSDAEVLELGCGTEGLAFDLAARGIEVLGISADPDDVEQARLEAVRRGIATARFGVMRTEELDLSDAAVDVVIGTGTLHRVDIARVVAEMARVLRPDGRVILLEPLGHNPLINAYRRRTGDRRDRFEHPIRRDDLSLASRWFGSVTVDTHHLLELVTAPAGGGSVASAARRLLRRADRTLLAPSSPLRWQAWIAVVELRDPRQ